MSRDEPRCAEICRDLPSRGSRTARGHSTPMIRPAPAPAPASTRLLLPLPTPLAGLPRRPAAPAKRAAGLRPAAAGGGGGARTGPPDGNHPLRSQAGGARPGHAAAVTFGANVSSRPVFHLGQCSANFRPCLSTSRGADCVSGSCRTRTASPCSCAGEDCVPWMTSRRRGPRQQCMGGARLCALALQLHAALRSHTYISGSIGVSGQCAAAPPSGPPVVSCNGFFDPLNFFAFPAFRHCPSVREPQCN